MRMTLYLGAVVYGMAAETPKIRVTGDVYRNMRNPYMLKDYYRFRTIQMIKDNEIYGSSPPDIFVGRIGWPQVYVGPLVPPQLGDTSMLGTPEMWVNKTIPEIVEMRSLLIRGMHRTSVKNADNGRVEEMIKEMALSEKYSNVDVKLKHAPTGAISFSENSQPFGPGAPLESMRIENNNSDTRLEAAYEDDAMGASAAMLELYEKGVEVSKIQRALAAGTLGRKGRRVFVPTRWSITAADDTISKAKLKAIKEYSPIDAVRIYENYSLDNRWIIMMVPGSWEYESMEAWYPNTTWNMNSKDIDLGASYEPFDGRKTYAEIGGCYYAARLAVSERLEALKGQAKVIILREVHSGYIMPVGVWNVREHVREALRTQPKVFSNLNEAVAYAASKLEIPIPVWMRNGKLLKRLFYQKVLSSYRF